MRCPNCGMKVKKRKCEHCKLKFVYDDNKQTVYFIIIFVALIALIAALLINYKRDKLEEPKELTSTQTTTHKVSLNKGVKKSILEPAKLGDILLATYSLDGVDYPVDVKGKRFLSTEEASKYIKTKDDEEAYGFEYVVTFNDLTDKENLNPVLDSIFIRDNGLDFIKINGKKKKVNTKSIYDGDNIKNGESAKVTVVYKLPTEYKHKHSICVGDVNKFIACFQRKEV